MNQRYLKKVSTIKLDAQACVGCGACAKVCPHGVFAVSGGKAALLDADRCMECGACARNCPASALSVRTGVGCAYAIILGRLLGTEPTCGCGGDEGASAGRGTGGAKKSGGCCGG